MDGIIVAWHHLIAAIGVDATGAKHVLGLVSGSSENARVVKDLLTSLSERGVDMNIPRLWVIDGSKALRSAIEQVCGDADAGIQKLKAHAKHLKAQHPDAAASLLEGLEELFTINRLGATGELARRRATTNVIEPPNSVV